MDIPQIGTKEAQWWRPGVLIPARYPAPFAAWRSGIGEGAGQRAQKTLRARLEFLYETDARIRGHYLFGAPFPWLDDRSLERIWWSGYEEEVDQINKLYEASFRFGVSAQRNENGHWKPVTGTAIPSLGAPTCWLLPAAGSSVRFCFDLNMEFNAVWRAMEPFRRSGDLPKGFSRRKFKTWFTKKAAGAGATSAPKPTETGELRPPNFKVLEWWDEWHVKRRTLTKSQLNGVARARLFHSESWAVIGTLEDHFYEQLLEAERNEILSRRRYPDSPAPKPKSRLAAKHEAGLVTPRGPKDFEELAGGDPA
jgi:hypothetical protein